MAVIKSFSLLIIFSLVLNYGQAYAECGKSKCSCGKAANIKEAKKVRLAVSGGSPSVQTVVFKPKK